MRDRSKMTGREVALPVNEKQPTLTRLIRKGCIFGRSIVPSTGRDPVPSAPGFFQQAGQVAG